MDFHMEESHLKIFYQDITVSDGLYAKHHVTTVEKGLADSLFKYYYCPAKEMEAIESLTDHFHYQLMT